MVRLNLLQGAMVVLASAMLSSALLASKPMTNAERFRQYVVQTDLVVMYSLTMIVTYSGLPPARPVNRYFPSTRVRRAFKFQYI